MLLSFLKEGEPMPTGTKIKEIRKRKGLTQKQLGDLCGIADANIRKYENGKQNPKMETLQKIADALEVPASELISISFKPIETELKMAEEAERIINGLEKDTTRMLDVEILQNFRKLNNDGQTEAAKRVQELTEIPRYTKPDAPELNAAHADNYADAPEELKEREEKMMDDEDF